MFLVRKVEKKDFTTWAQMRAHLWPDNSSLEHLKEIHEFHGQPTYQAWVAVSEEKIVGFVEASVRPFANGCNSHPVAFLEGIWVEEPFRKKGFAAQMVRAVEGWALSKGISELGSDANLSNIFSHSRHRQWGFTETERVVYFRKSLG